MTMSNDGRNPGISCRWALPLAAVAVLALIVAAGQWGPKATEATLPPPTATSVPLPGGGTVYLSFDVSVLDNDNDLGQGTCHFELKVDVYRHGLGLATPGPLDSDRFDINTYSDRGLSTEGCQFATIFVPITITPGYEAGYGTITEAQNGSSGILEFGPPANPSATGPVKVFGPVGLTSTYFQPRQMKDGLSLWCTYSSFVDGHCTVASTQVLDAADPNKVDAAMQGGTADIGPSPSTPPPPPAPTPTATATPSGTVNVSVTLCVQDYLTGTSYFTGTPVPGTCHFDMRMSVNRCALNQNLGPCTDTALPDPTGSHSQDYDEYTITDYWETQEGSCTFATNPASPPVTFNVFRDHQVPPDDFGGFGYGSIAENTPSPDGTLDFPASGPLKIDSLGLHSAFPDRRITPLTGTCTYSQIDAGQCKIDPVNIYDAASGEKKAEVVDRQGENCNIAYFVPSPSTPTATPRPLGVGGQVNLPPGAIAAESGSASEGSDSSNGAYAALAGGIAAAFAAIGIGGWYARRRWRLR